MLASGLFYGFVGIYFSSLARTTARAYAATFFSLLLLMSGFWVIAPVFGHTGVYLATNFSHLISPLVLCFKYGEKEFVDYYLFPPNTVVGAVWRRDIFLQMAWMAVGSLILYCMAVARIKQTRD